MSQKTSQKGSKSKGGKVFGWILVLLVGGGGVFAAFHFTTPPPVEVPTARVRRGEFVLSVRGRGEVKSARSVMITTPRTPNPRIVRLAAAGQMIKKGEPVTLEFTALDVVMGFKLPDFGVRTDVIPGKTTRLRLVPMAAGTFVFLCDIFCGEGHEDMTGKLVVVE